MLLNLKLASSISYLRGPVKESGHQFRDWEETVVTYFSLVDVRSTFCYTLVSKNGRLRQDGIGISNHYCCWFNVPGRLGRMEMVSVLERSADVAENESSTQPQKLKIDPRVTPPELVQVQKETFLAAFARDGGLMRTSKDVGVWHRTVQRWQAEDPEFAKGYQEAIQAYREHLEQFSLLSRLSDAKCPPLLVIFALKGAWREKYGDDVHAVNDAAALLLKKLEGMKGGSTAMQGSEVVRGSLLEAE